VLTLFLVPVVYILFDLVGERMRHRGQAMAPARAEGP